jgi:hypothetical protein
MSVPTVLIRVPLGVAKSVGSAAAGVAKGAYGVVAGHEETAPESHESDFVSRTPASGPAESGNGRARDPRPEVVVDPVPEHVSEEPVLVAEVAEEGAEDGAGAEVSIEEPWPGYDDMTAADIEDRLVIEADAVVAAVKLYEASRKGRAAVLEAASRNMS